MAARLLTLANSIGVSPTWIVRKKPRNHTVHIIVFGAPSAVTVDLDGSLDGINWASLNEHIMSAEELAAGIAIFHTVDKPIRYVRIALTELTSGGGATVSAFYEGETV